MISEDESELSQRKSKGVTAVFGIYICNDCNNMITPVNANGHILQFKCHVCGTVSVDFSNRPPQDCMLYSKELEIGSKKYEAEVAFIFDPTMPRVKLVCPFCYHDTAVYLLTPDVGEAKMMARMICTRQMTLNNEKETAKCGHIWQLGEEANLLKDKVTNHGVEEPLFGEESD